MSIGLLALFGTFVLYEAAAPDSDDRTSYTANGGSEEPAAWEFTYMYTVSLLAAGWVVGRALAHWQVVPRRILLVPRDPSDSSGQRSDWKG